MIDWDRVEELQREVGEDDFAEIAALFLSELSDAVDTLFALSDPDDLRAACHGLKGSALNLGFRQLAELASAAERAPASIDRAAIRSAAEQAEAGFTARFPGLAA